MRAKVSPRVRRTRPKKPVIRRWPSVWTPIFAVAVLVWRTDSGMGAPAIEQSLRVCLGTPEGGSPQRQAQVGATAGGVPTVLQRQGATVGLGDLAAQRQSDP